MGGGEVTKWGQWEMSMGPSGALWGLAKPNEASAGPNGARGIQKGLMGVPGVIRGSPGDSGGSLGFPGGHVGEIRAPPPPPTPASGRRRSALLRSRRKPRPRSAPEAEVEDGRRDGGGERAALIGPRGIT